MFVRFAAACLLAGSLTGCVNAPTSASGPVEVPGTSLAASSALLVSDTMNVLGIFSRAKSPPCSDVRLAKADIVEPVSNGNYDAEGRLPEGASWVEVWTLDRCGVPDYYRVTFVSDGQGGAFIRVGAEGSV